MVFPGSPGILEEKLEDNKNVFSIDVCPDFKFQAGYGQTGVE